MGGETEAERRRKEAYFTASQRQLIWARFRKNRPAMIAGTVLVLLILMGIFAPFLGPYD
ncbi:MAG: ABC transporter permease, partial [Alphaproteobacteria bacterium]